MHKVIVQTQDSTQQYPTEASATLVTVYLHKIAALLAKNWYAIGDYQFKDGRMVGFSATKEGRTTTITACELNPSPELDGQRLLNEWVEGFTQFDDTQPIVVRAES